MFYKIIMTMSVIVLGAYLLFCLLIAGVAKWQRIRSDEHNLIFFEISRIIGLSILLGFSFGIIFLIVWVSLGF